MTKSAREREREGKWEQSNKSIEMFNAIFLLPLIASHCILQSCIRWHSRCGALCNRQSHAHVHTHVGTHHMQSQRQRQRQRASSYVCVCLFRLFVCVCVSVFTFQFYTSLLFIRIALCNVSISTFCTSLSAAGARSLLYSLNAALSLPLARV